MTEPEAHVEHNDTLDDLPKLIEMFNTASLEVTFAAKRKEALSKRLAELLVKTCSHGAVTALHSALGKTFK